MAKHLELTPRLGLLASWVRPGAKLADVGTDHAYLPVWLMLHGGVSSAIASDLRSGPLQRARENAEAWGVTKRLDLRLCDGLSGIGPEECDTVVIAGMGGENIAAILRAAPWACRNALCILQPMSRPEELRTALPSLGLTIRAERLVRDAGRLYSVLAVRAGAPEALSAGELYCGKYSGLERHAVLRCPRGTGQTARYRRSRSGTLRTGERP